MPHNSKNRQFNQSTNGAQRTAHIKWAAHLCVCISVWRCFRVYTGGSPLSINNIVNFSYSLPVEKTRKKSPMEVLVILFGLLFALGIAIAAAALASRKNRNPVNWFFVSCFWGIIGLIVLACSEKLNKEEYESDTLVTVMWLILLIPFSLLIILSL